MNLTATCLGAGTLLVAICLKQIPEDKLNLVSSKLQFNESQSEDGDDYFSAMQRRMQGKIKKSETERLLESYWLHVLISKFDLHK